MGTLNGCASLSVPIQSSLSPLITLLVIFSFSPVCLAQDECGDSLERINLVIPKYPVIEVRPIHTGSVIVEFILLKDGSVKDARVFKVSSKPTDKYAKAFGRSAIGAVSESTFTAKHLPCRGQYKFTYEVSNG